MKHRIPLLCLLAASLLFAACTQEEPVPSGPYPGDVHYHADFKVYLNGQPFDFAQEKYQSEGTSVKSTYIHLHEGNGDVIHLERSQTNLSYFFASLDMKFNSTCFRTDANQSFCTNETHALSFLVNGAHNNAYGSYVFNDLDRMLISYSPINDPAVLSQMDSVTDKACIESEKCPERGSPATEEDCTGSGTCPIEPLVRE